jgi:hypothetical protein
VCRYGGLNDLPPFTLTAHDLLTKNAARRLANLIDEIPVGHVAGATFSCPPADGSAVVFVLSFASRPDVDVWHARTDCPAPSNRKITALVTIHASDFAAGIADSGVRLGGSVIPEAAPSRLCPVRSGPRAPDVPIMPGGCSAWRDSHPLHTGGNLQPSTKRLSGRLAVPRDHPLAEANPSDGTTGQTGRQDPLVMPKIGIAGLRAGLVDLTPTDTTRGTASWGRS